MDPPLITCAKEGNFEEFERLLNKPPLEINIQDTDGRTAISHAAQNGHAEMVQLLHDYGANIDLADSEGRRPLYWAQIPASYTEWDPKRREIVQFLAAQTTGHEYCDPAGRTVLFAAAQHGTAVMVRRFLPAVAEIDYRNEFDINGPGNKTRSLIAAARSGDIETMRVFLDYESIDVNVIDEHGHSPYYYVTALPRLEHRAEAIRWLLKAGVQLHIVRKDPAFHSPPHPLITLVAAATSNISEATRDRFLEVTANRDACDDNDNTALHFAAHLGLMDVVERLVSADSYIDAYNSNPQTPAQLARGSGHDDIADYLEDKNRNFTATTPSTTAS
ncbi:ankyrin repeat-containing domain protein [Podospora didyma]|uniref:Ankyrin repeat-containing domain protein n=1 Tax=Podospora didyma TaxID=330526 RepID=A0AAE0N2T7_9PEZI|nr:ankyrin repeat-containing domain protein [Podospora didyma]